MAQCSVDVMLLNVALQLTGSRRGAVTSLWHANMAAARVLIPYMEMLDVRWLLLFGIVCRRGVSGTVLQMAICSHVQIRNCERGIGMSAHLQF